MEDGSSRFTSDRRTHEEASWVGEGDWELGTAENVDVTADSLVGRPPIQASEAPGTEFYGFEDGEWSNDWVDESQSSGSIYVTDSRAYEGSYSLDVSSNPGTNTACKARSRSTWLGANVYRLYLNKYKDGGGHNVHSFLILNESDTNQCLRIRASSYSQPYVVLDERDASGSTINTWALRDNTDTPMGRWFEMSIDVRGPDTVVATVDGDSVSVTPDADWAGMDVRMEIAANGWGSGDKMYTAADNVEVHSQND